METEQNAEREAPIYKVIGQALNTGYAVLEDGHKIAWFPTYREARDAADAMEAEALR